MYVYCMFLRFRQETALRSPIGIGCGTQSRDGDQYFQWRNIDPEASVDGKHHVGGLDDRIGTAADFQFQFVDGFIGDRRRDDSATADVDADMGSRRALGDLGDRALQTVARADFHKASPDDEAAGCEAQL